MTMGSYQAFVVQRRADLRRIASRTQGEHAFEDVAAEAWLVAQQIAAKRGFEFSFSHRSDQEQLLAWLHNKLVKYADKQLRYAVKLDKDWDKEDADGAVHSMARLLAAPDTFDPAVQLLLKEGGIDPAVMTRHSYSQASAYVILLCRFDWDAEALALHLRIVMRTLLARLRWFGGWTRLQSSLFDGIQTIAIDFLPMRSPVYAPRLQSQANAGSQTAWDFPTPTPCNATVD